MAEHDWIFEPGYPTSSKTPSRKDGISADVETKLRQKGIVFIEQVAKELRLNRIVVTSACVLFHRFFAIQSFKQHNRLVSLGLL
jgi:hypothetical protein